MGSPEAPISCQIVLDYDYCPGSRQAIYNHSVWLESGTGMDSGSLVESDGWLLVKNRMALSC